MIVPGAVSYSSSMPANETAAGTFAFSIRFPRLTALIERAAICVAGRREDGLIHVEVVEHRKGTSWVAARLVELALAVPGGLVPPIAGPDVIDMADLVRGYLRLVGKRRPILRVPTPGRAAAAIRGGANLAPDRAVGRRTWDDFLASSFGTSSDRGRDGSRSARPAEDANR